MLTPVQETYGPMFIGVMFNIILYGFSGWDSTASRSLLVLVRHSQPGLRHCDNVRSACQQVRVRNRKFQVVGILWLVGAALADVLITTALLWHLRTHKTGMLATDDLINKIIRLTVQTGLITALFAVICLVLYPADAYGWLLLTTAPSPESLGHSGPRSGVNVNVLRGEEGRRKSHRVSERIVIGAESHQMDDDFTDVKDDHYAPNAMSFIPDEKTLSPIEEV
ncbi:hypothetical protein LXA43DRAFT_1057036 [Ganoderma leucocontextum]|nr:hypothetical protein LXA43DRAFT_1057036 [Ganoderma leucocontextum]